MIVNERGSDTHDGSGNKNVVGWLVGCVAWLVDYRERYETDLTD